MAQARITRAGYVFRHSADLVHVALEDCDWLLAYVVSKTQFR